MIEGLLTAISTLVGWVTWAFDVQMIVSVFLGGGVALYVGQLLQNKTDRRRFRQSLAAVLTETGSNHAIVSRVLQGKSWTTSGFGQERPSVTITEAVQGDPALYRNDADRGLILALTLYRIRVESVDHMMDLCLEQGRKQAKLTAGAIYKLHRTCRDAQIAIEVAQARLDALKLRLGKKSELVELQEQLKSKAEELSKRSPLSKPDDGELAKG